MGEVIVVTSGKGGVGKTTTAANIGTGLAAQGKKVVLLDTDIGLRNLDVVMGLENRICLLYTSLPAKLSQAAPAAQQETEPEAALPEGLTDIAHYLAKGALAIRKNVRSGQKISYDGTLIVFGDVNAGAELVATGHILVPVSYTHLDVYKRQGKTGQ